MKSPPRTLYDIEYYKSSCEGFDFTIDNPSPRLKIYDTWIGPQIEGVVADIGFGRGELSIKTARNPKVKSVWAFDYSYDAGKLFMESLEKEPKLSDKVAIIIADFVDFLPHLDVAFDNIIMFDVIEHIYPEQIKTVTDQFNKKLKVGGKIFLSTPLSAEPCNERHVWMAKNLPELQAMFPNEIVVSHKGYSGVGDENWFEAIKIS